MRRRARSFLASTILWAAIFAGLGPSATPATARAEESGRFAVLSDIHFNPFADPRLAATLAETEPSAWRSTLAPGQDGPTSRTGEDTNFPLFASALGAFARAMASADFALTPGDLIAHEFNAKAATSLGVAPMSPAAHRMAARTALFVAESLAGTLAGKPAIVALGNVDAGCGDYRLDPHGGYLAATKDLVRRLAGAARVAPDFDATWSAGGYYAVGHPTVPGLLIVVLNDVLWSTHYEDACGSGGRDAAGTAMLDWLRDLLARQRAAGRRIWMVHHIPWGIDAFSTVVKRAATCGEKVVPFLREPYATAFPDLIRTYGDVVQASFSGHTHFDDYRVMTGEHGAAVALDKLSPALSPIFGQNRAFQVFSYDRRSGAPIDFST
ncbi:metallophosphoesterase [Reyranella sp.]|uniref:metallophosphoesterase n=1 Tax=Reyranella sp. TaxID=1929291 RepID=UPI003BAAA31C